VTDRDPDTINALAGTIMATDGLMELFGFHRVDCDVCGYPLFTRTDDGDLCCRMCGEPYLNPSNSSGPELQPDADS
jgi:hypothetical protein